ncbi:hypothetical protein WJX84_001409, partial [Apatococcus fuscideae]
MPRSPFAKLLGRVFGACGIEFNQDTWKANDSKKKLATPVKTKISSDSCTTIEVKVTYKTSRVKKQLYQVELYLFCPQELLPVKFDFYGQLWQVIRLHSPKVPSLGELSNGTGPAHIIPLIQSRLKAYQMLFKGERKMSKKEAKQQVEAEALIIQQFRLYVCMMRASIRKQSDCITKSTKSVQIEQANDIRSPLIQSIICLVAETLEAILSLRAACECCEGRDASTDLLQAWKLVDEFALAEADRSLLKLLLELDKMRADMQLMKGASEEDASIKKLRPLPPRSPGLICMQQQAESFMLPRADIQAAILQKLSSDGGTNGSPSIPYPSAVRNGDRSIPGIAIACQLVRACVMELEDDRRRRGYTESILTPDAPHGNEAYTNRLKVLKHNARAAVSLKPEVLNPSFILADIVGSTIAGIAMATAVVGTWLAFGVADARNQFQAVYIAIIIVFYMLKDRIKEWGKRYLQPIAEWFGLEFPDRIVNVTDRRGKKVGLCKEATKISGDSSVNHHVRLMRHHDKGHIPSHFHETRPEKVLAYRRRMYVYWPHVDPQLQGVDGLDDVLQVDLSWLTRRMQPSRESHYCLSSAATGTHAEKIKCARVYHINLVLRVRTRLAGGHDDRSMQIHRARIIMDKNGIKRLEAADQQLHYQGASQPRTAGQDLSGDAELAKRLQDEEIARAQGHTPSQHSSSAAGQASRSSHDADLAAAMKQSTLEASSSNYSHRNSHGGGPSHYHTFPNGAESSLPASRHSPYPSYPPSSQPYPQVASSYAPGVHANGWREDLHGPADPFDLLLEREQAGIASQALNGGSGHTGYPIVDLQAGQPTANGRPQGGNEKSGLQSSPSLLDDWPIGPPPHPSTRNDESLARSLQLDEDLSSALQSQTPGSSQPFPSQPPEGNPFSSFQAPSAGTASNHHGLHAPTAGGSANGSASGWNPFHAQAGGPQAGVSSSGSGQQASQPPSQKGPFTTSGRFSPPVSLPSSSSGKRSGSPAPPSTSAASASAVPKAPIGNKDSCAG